MAFNMLGQTGQTLTGAFGPNRAAVQIHQILDDGESQAQPSMLPPGQIVPLAAVDLREWFELSENGYYQVSLGNAILRFSQGAGTADSEQK